MFIPFAACIGLAQLFIAIDIAKLGRKKTILFTLSLGLFLSAVNYLTIELFTPETMFHRKFSLSLGVLVFAFYALTLPLLFRNRRIVCLIISIISCILYWALLVLGENLALKLGENGIVNAWFPTLLFVYITVSFYLVHKLIELHKRTMDSTPSGA